MEWRSHYPNKSRAAEELVPGTSQGPVDPCGAETASTMAFALVRLTLSVASFGSARASRDNARVDPEGGPH